jgi:hypothetical protein
MPAVMEVPVEEVSDQGFDLSSDDKALSGIRKDMSVASTSLGR